MKRKLVLFTLLLATATTLFMAGCKKDSVLDEPMEPIALVQPDSATVRLFAGDSLPIEIKFTTDRPINWIKGMYEVDTAGLTNFAATYPDTLFFMHLDTLDPRVNLYTHNALYRIPDTLKAFSVVYFEVSFEAGKSTFTSGQNYPAGIVTRTKRFKINVR